MDTLDERLDARPIAAGGAGPVVRALSVKEWEQIETVSHSVRIVADIMQAEAAALATGSEPESPPALPFDAKVWEAVRPGGKVPPSGLDKLKQKTGRAATLIKLEEKLQSDDRAKVAAAATIQVPPRLEPFGKRTEAFAAAFCSWAKALKAPVLDVVVSCNRACLFPKSQVWRRLSACGSRTPNLGVSCCVEGWRVQGAAGGYLSHAKSTW